MKDRPSSQPLTAPHVIRHRPSSEPLPPLMSTVGAPLISSVTTPHLNREATVEMPLQDCIPEQYSSAGFKPSGLFCSSVHQHRYAASCAAGAARRVFAVASKEKDERQTHKSERQNRNGSVENRKESRS